MNFIVSADTDIGIAKSTNQDSLSVMTLSTAQGKMTFAILCDGMGGLQKGEVASGSVVRAFRKWAVEKLPTLCAAPLQDAVIRSQWEQVVMQQNQAIHAFGHSGGLRLGTTAVVMLLTQDRYYILNVGDSRAYEFADHPVQITADQTLVARDVAQGNITPEQALHDPRKNVLLQCIGASDTICVEMFFGSVKQNAVYMLCSDGFRHEITPEEMYELLRPDVLFSERDMLEHARALIELNKQRQEKDNISVVLVRTF